MLSKKKGVGQPTPFKVFVILLAYNEEKTIGELIKEIHRILKERDILHEFIVVNDGSTDNTEGVVKKLMKSVPVNLENHPVNMGPGAAFLTGIKKAVSLANDDDIIITMESDFTNLPECIPLMVEKLKKESLDVVVASRFEKGGKYVGFPPGRLLFSLVANYMVRFFFPVPGIRDYTIFYRAYRASLLKKALEIYKDNFITSTGFSSNVEMMVKLRRFKIRGGEVPLVYRYDLKPGRSKMKVMKTLKEYGSLFVKSAG